MFLGSSLSFQWQAKRCWKFPSHLQEWAILNGKFHGSKREVLKISRRFILKYIKRDLGVFVFKNMSGPIPVAQLDATVPVVPGGNGKGIEVADDVVRPPPTTMVTVPIPLAQPTTMVTLPIPLAQPTTMIHIPVPPHSGAQARTGGRVNYGIMTVNAMQEAHAHVVALATVSGVKAVPKMLQKLCRTTCLWRL